ncbi:MAG: GNAT family N-acetyltransferase [Planctomycetota bacterium]
MLIRSLLPTDANAYTDLRREMLLDAPWAFGSSPEDDVAVDAASLARLGEVGMVIIGAFEDVRLVGSAGVMLRRQRKMAHRAMIWGVYVAPGARGGGVGKAVVRRAMDTARTWPGVTSVSLSASAKAVAAVAMYRSLGFVPWGVEPGCLMIDGKALDEFHMIAPLGQL